MGKSTALNTTTTIHRLETPSREKRARFAKVIHSFKDKELAQAADCTIQAVRAWKSEKQFINGANLIDLAANIPAVREWLNAEIERGNATEYGDPATIEMIVRRVIQQMGWKYP